MSDVDTVLPIGGICTGMGLKPPGSPLVGGVVSGVSDSPAIKLLNLPQIELDTLSMLGFHDESLLSAGACDSLLAKSSSHRINWAL
jgi:hypothetical protein